MSNRRASDFHYVTDKGSSGYAYDAEAMAGWIEFYAKRGEAVTVFAQVSVESVLVDGPGGGR